MAYGKGNIGGKNIYKTTISLAEDRSVYDKTGREITISANFPITTVVLKTTCGYPRAQSFGDGRESEITLAFIKNEITTIKMDLGAWQLLNTDGTHYSWDNFHTSLDGVAGGTDIDCNNRTPQVYSFTATFNSNGTVTVKIPNVFDGQDHFYIPAIYGTINVIAK